MQENVYFCTKNVIKLRNKTLFTAVLGLFWCYTLFILEGCSSRVKQPEPIWGNAEDSTESDGFDLGQIQANGELIMLTVSGAET